MNGSSVQMQAIASIHSDFATKFGVPRQSGLVESLKASIIFEPAWRDPNAVRGLEGYSYIWVIWQFSRIPEGRCAVTVRPPRLGGDVRMGVFATRSPFRPNHMGLSSLRLDSIEYTEKLGPILHVSGADLVDETPILDIKPYLPYTDSHPEAAGGFTDLTVRSSLHCVIPKELLRAVPAEKREALRGILENDPRPPYQKDPERSYGFVFADLEIHFSVEGSTLTVTGIAPAEQ